MTKVIRLFVLLFLLSNCGTNVKEEKPSTVITPPPVKPSVTEDDLITRLSIDLIASPNNQQEREQNVIINHAIDKLWNVQRTNSGLYYEILDEGQGDPIQWGDYIEVHYEGKFMDGQVFDSSRKRKRPMQFYVGNMIDGWNEGLQLIKPNGRIRLLVPSPLAYGEKGLVAPKGDTLVAADKVLLFDIEVLRWLK